MLNIRKLAIFSFVYLYATLAQATPTTINVGGYLFPPFVQVNNASVSGLTLDLIELFNNTQSEYNFEFILTSPKRRYRDFERGLFDVLFFENKNWSWQKYDLNESMVFLSGGEVFIANLHNNRNQTYFDDLGDKQLVGILGYHYGFANHETDIQHLKKSFNIRFVNSPQTVISQVISGKSDIGILTYSYIQQKIKNNPELALKLLISNKFDQTYQHKIIMRNNNLITTEAINRLLMKVLNDGSLNSLLNKYGLSPLK
ncbi:transporter substrate-binding domain-containing protein [Oceaniserpentilla sp. 4NH20-0058]|uniref:substrate-binding periplasmic protein n=1 Tax=Oceaniserpentilla sp. 4NH20-0058 TaxID=3127660 RepID=UPI003341B380